MGKNTTQATWVFRFFEAKFCLMSQIFLQNLWSSQNAVHKRNQRRGESIMQYTVELRHLARHCEYGNHLQDALRDRLVCGIRNKALCKRLLAEENLDLKKAKQIATAMEIAAHDASGNSHPRVKATNPLWGCSSNDDRNETCSEGPAKISRTGCRRGTLSVKEDRTLTTSMLLSRIRLPRMQKNGPHSRSLQGSEETNKRDESALNDTTSKHWINWKLSMRPAGCPLTGRGVRSGHRSSLHFRDNSEHRQTPERLLRLQPNRQWPVNYNGARHGLGSLHHTGLYLQGPLQRP